MTDETAQRDTQDPALTEANDRLRFAFGENWTRFLDSVDAIPLCNAEQSIRVLLETDSLKDRRFLDAGSGSGLFSYAARRLGAQVCSIDFDPRSVACTERLKRLSGDTDEAWVVRRGSVLDVNFLNSLGTFDVVYSWGVLHHTGAMWRALGNVAALVQPGGTLCVALYNDQGFASRLWRLIKQAYNRCPPCARFLVLWPSFIRLWGPTFVKDLVHGAPLRTWRHYAAERGMSPMIDVRDWVGGYPFEVATPANVQSFCVERGFTLVKCVRRSGIGCNEFVFVHDTR